MRRLRAANEPRCARARAKIFNRLHGGLFQRWMIGEPQIIIGRKIQHLTTFQPNPRALR